VDKQKRGNLVLGRFQTEKEKGLGKKKKERLVRGGGLGNENSS